MTTFNFGEQQNTQSGFGGFSFGSTPSNTTALNLTSQANPSTSVFGGGTTAFGGFSAATTTTTSNIFGTTQTAPAFSTSLFPSSTTTTSSFPAIGTSAAAPGAFSFGGFNNPTSSSSATFGTNLSLVPSSATTSSAPIGLGGVDVQTTTSLSGGNTANKKDSKAAKESTVPNEIAVLIEAFKKHVKEQKTIREEMSRVSSKNMFKVQEQVNTLKQQLSIVSNGLQRNAFAIAKLKEESVQELKNAELAQRTKDSLSSLDYENNAPTEYFHNLANSFEKQMQSYRQQIEQLERHLLSLSQPFTLTPNEWTDIRRRLHDTFVTLAAQLQSVHQEIQFYKEHFINSQRINQDELRMFSNKDDLINSNLTSHLPVSVTYGPSPFKAMQSEVGKAITNVFNRSQLSGSSTLAGIGFSHLESGVGGAFLSFSGRQVSSFQSTSPFKPLGRAGLFGSSTLNEPPVFPSDNSAQSQFAFNNQKPFQLQKPPPGNKRGKRWTST